MAVGLVHFAVRCGLEFKDINPVTAIVIPLHKGVREGTYEYGAGLILLMDPRILSLSLTTIQSHVKKIREIAVHSARFKNRFLIITSPTLQENNAQEVKGVCFPPTISQNSLVIKIACEEDFPRPRNITFLN